MIGLETKINEAESPFHKARIPYYLISFLAAEVIDLLALAWRVLSTQKGLVQIVAMHPATPEHLLTLRNELGSNPSFSLALA